METLGRHPVFGRECGGAGRRALTGKKVRRGIAQESGKTCILGTLNRAILGLAFQPLSIRSLDADPDIKREATPCSHCRISATASGGTRPAPCATCPSLSQRYRASGFEKYLRIARPEIDPLAPWSAASTPQLQDRLFDNPLAQHYCRSDRTGRSFFL